jgi:hypothetical protein
VKTWDSRQRSWSGQFTTVEIWWPLKEDVMPSAYISTILAGILIGALNETWPARFLVPLGWGYFRCMYQWLLKGHRDFSPESAAEKLKLDNPNPWAQKIREYLLRHPPFAFYFMEYFKAYTISLFFSVAAGLIKSLF